MAGRIDAVGRGFYEPHLDPGGRAVAWDGQDAIQYMLEMVFMEMAMNRFEWTGLPDEVEIRWMELSLLETGLSVFHYDDEYGKYFAMRGSGAGNINMVGKYTQYMVYGNQFYTKTLNAEDCVPIWANYMRAPVLRQIKIYAARLAQIDRSIEINSLNARRGKVARMSEKTKLSIDNIIAEIDRGASVVKMVPEVMLNELLDVVDFGVDPDTIVNLHILRTREWQEAVNLFGVNSSNQDKKERLTAAETSGNDDIIATIRATALQARQQACKQINDKYGLNVEVEYVTDMSTAELKGVNDGDAQNGSTGVNAQGAAQ